MTRRKAYTIIEIVVALVIIGILATIGMPYYQNFVEDNKAQVCSTCLKTLQTAIDIYSVEHDALPANLSQLPQKYIREAYQRVMTREDAWKTELAYFITGWREYGIARAAFLKDEIARGNVGLITCPKDTTPPSKGGTSYGINAALSGLSSGTYKNLPGDTLIIGDCENPTFGGTGDLAQRHKRYKLVTPQSYYQVANKNGDVINNLP